MQSLRLVGRFSLSGCWLLAASLAFSQDAPPPVQPSPQQQSPVLPDPKPAPPSTAPTPDAPSQAKADEAERLRKEEIKKKEQSYRVLGVLPRFGTTHVNAEPLTSHEKFVLYLRGAYDPVTLTILAGQAGVGQAENTHEGYGQGVEGYAKRLGADVTDSATSNFFSNFFYPVIFKQDPRYFRLGKGRFMRRLTHSLIEQVVAHQDSGGRAPHYSNIFGAITSGGISNLYYPKEDRGFVLTVEGAGTAMAYGEFGGLLSEFWPDIQNRLMKKKKYPDADILGKPETAPAGPQADHISPDHASPDQAPLSTGPATTEP